MTAFDAKKMRAEHDAGARVGACSCIGPSLPEPCRLRRTLDALAALAAEVDKYRHEWQAPTNDGQGDGRCGWRSPDYGDPCGIPRSANDEVHRTSTVVISEAGR